MSKCRKTSVNSVDERVVSSSSSETNLSHSHKTGRRLCPHCDESLSLKTYYFHKRLFFNKVSMFLHVCAKCTRSISGIQETQEWDRRSSSSLPRFEETDVEQDCDMANSPPRHVDLTGVRIDDESKSFVETFPLPLPTSSVTMGCETGMLCMQAFKSDIVQVV